MSNFQATAPVGDYDNVATLDRIRKVHGPVAAYCRDHDFGIANLYSALRGVRGRKRKGSEAALIIKHLDEAGLLVRKQA